MVKFTWAKVQNLHKTVEELSRQREFHPKNINISPDVRVSLMPAKRLDHVHRRDVHSPLTFTYIAHMCVTDMMELTSE